ncbi:hypothetical protein BCR41DRAFT_379268 [Lobosporangium transversale]|uniref:Uncharacterized protein n=1 Tax=Lobosporangium transversale TaxID=64571 RepID=A0A1Y2G8Z5_9FUNG|nr:hypothetical protein BCR41DRAFT_379268 [Lobosporangium transversale]ORY99710.1 hypothetical protein BCR41DRAFT_379268 [Lobosporangium transversale]|eukprot:XP_021875974.1 hypothetical protein BCR41DRAFT_379268 [Lobosporangium transversale]
MSSDRKSRHHHGSRRDHRSSPSSSSRRHHSGSRSRSRSKSRSRSSPHRSRSGSSKHRSSRSSRSHRHGHHDKGKKRSRRSRSRSRSRSISTDRSSDSDDSSISDSESDRDRKRRKHGGSSGSSRRKKDRKDKKKKKDKKKSKKERGNSASKEFGTYGILTPADMWNKENEFQAWLMEVKHLNPETIPQNKMKEHFVGFMEDYNTVTMPHEKFYNLAKWEERQRAIRMGEPLPEEKAENAGALNLMNDEEMLRMRQRDKRKMNLSSQPKILMTQSQLQELRKVSHERVEADRLRKMGLDAGRRGVRYE